MFTTGNLFFKEQNMQMSQQSPGLLFPCLGCFLEMTVKHKGSSPVLLTGQRGLLEVKASVPKPRAFWQQCCNCQALTRMIDLQWSHRKRMWDIWVLVVSKRVAPDLTQFLLPEFRNMERVWIKSQIFNKTHLWLRQPGLTGRHGGEGAKPSWTSTCTRPPRTFGNRAYGYQKMERGALRLNVFSKFENLLENNQMPSPSQMWSLETPTMALPHSKCPGCSLVGPEAKPRISVRNTRISAVPPRRESVGFRNKSLSSCPKFIGYETLNTSFGLSGPNFSIQKMGIILSTSKVRYRNQMSSDKWWLDHWTLPEES